MARILVIDDDDILRGSIADVLLASGYLVAEAQNGAEAIEIITQQGEFDVILSDVKMPHMDGIAFLKEVKARYPTISIVMLTGHGTIDTAVEAMRHGALNYLLKPATQDQLLESVAEAIDVREETLQKQMLMGQIVSGLQRLGIAKPQTPSAASKRFATIDDLSIDQHRLVALFRGEPLDLTPTEFDILSYLIEARGRVVTFEEIALRLQGVQLERDEARSMISTHISNLRHKLQKAGAAHYLMNSRGHGYYINVESQ